MAGTDQDYAATQHPVPDYDLRGTNGGFAGTKLPVLTAAMLLPADGGALVTGCNSSAAAQVCPRLWRQ
eukprot:1175947-Rhodomonas_salina.2